MSRALLIHLFCVVALLLACNTQHSMTFDRNNLLTYKSIKKYRESSYIVPNYRQMNTYVSLEQLVCCCFGKGEQETTHYCFELDLTFTDPKAANDKGAFNLVTDTLLIKSYFGASSRKERDKLNNEQNFVTGNIQIIDWDPDYRITLKENIRACLRGSKDTFRYIGIRTFKPAKYHIRF